MKGDDRHTSAWTQEVDNPAQKSLDFFQLAVHRDTQCLKRPRGRMVAGQGAPPGRVGRRHDPGQFQRGLDLFLFPGRDHGPGDASGQGLLSVFPDQFFQALAGGGIYDIGGRLRSGIRIHAHVQRSVVHKGKASLRTVQLQGGHSQIRDDPVHGVPTRLGQGGLEKPEGHVRGHDPLSIRGEPRAGCIQSLPVPVQTEQPRPAGGQLHDPSGMAAKTQGRVQIPAARPGRDPVHDLVQHDRNVTGRRIHWMFGIVVCHATCQKRSSKPWAARSSMV